MEKIINKKRTCAWVLHNKLPVKQGIFLLWPKAQPGFQHQNSPFRELRGHIIDGSCSMCMQKLCKKREDLKRSNVPQGNQRRPASGIIQHIQAVAPPPLFPSEVGTYTPQVCRSHTIVDLKLLQCQILLGAQLSSSFVVP